MGGIYIHIPFCHKACHYCDFHFSTNLGYVDQMVEALCREIQLKSPGFFSEVDTLYFGGGTPSILSAMQIRQIICELDKRFQIKRDAEITLEANPEDISAVSTGNWKAAGINRLSIGIQTFDDKRLKFLNRNHSGKKAMNCIETARGGGISNITVDLIYAIPPEDMGYWQLDLERIIEFDIPHLSIYGLTIEEKTVFGNWLKSNKLTPVQEEINEKQYLLAESILTRNGYEHYEVSNYAKPGFYSRHNSGYWLQKPYMGIGPGAHSFDLYKRYFNISNNHKYMKSIAEGVLPETVEQLSDTQRVNEYILTRSRTSYGLDFVEIKEKYGKSLDTDQQDFLDQLIRSDLANIQDRTLRLTSSGLKIADEIALKLFYNE